MRRVAAPKQKEPFYVAGPVCSRRVIDRARIPHHYVTPLIQSPLCGASGLTHPQAKKRAQEVAFAAETCYSLGMSTPQLHDAGYRLTTPKGATWEHAKSQEVSPDLLPFDPEDEYDDLVLLPKTSHPWPVRVSLIVLGCTVAVLNAAFHLGISDAVVLALIGLVTAGVAGDTVRPSGMAAASRAKPLPKDK